MNTNLMGIFSHSLSSNHRKAREVYETIDVSKFFVFELTEEENLIQNQFIMTFNVMNNDLEKLNIFKDKFKILRLHRKKETDTLYTINALNEIIKTSKNPDILWENYKNNLLITKQKLIQKFGLTLIKVIDIHSVD